MNILSNRGCVTDRGRKVSEGSEVCKIRMPMLKKFASTTCENRLTCEVYAVVHLPKDVNRFDSLWVDRFTENELNAMSFDDNSIGRVRFKVTYGT